MSQAKIYVGNLPYNTSEDELRDLFAQYGEIEDVKLIVDFNTGRSKGFGFITFSTAEASESALAANGQDMGGRKLKVNAARESTGGRGGRGGRGGFGGGGNRGGNGNFRGNRDNFGNQDDRF